MLPAIVASESGPSISIAPEVLWHWGPFAVSNSQVLGLLGAALVAWLLLSTARAARHGKRMNRLQGMVMMIFEMLYKTTVDVIGDRETARRVIRFALPLCSSSPLTTGLACCQAWVQ